MAGSSTCIMSLSMWQKLIAQRTGREVCSVFTRSIVLALTSHPQKVSSLSLHNAMTPVR